jgi:hypothetical protein
MSDRRFALIVWLAGLAAAAVQALAMAARYFHPRLSADYIYPQLFAQDVLAGNYPLSGWTLSSAPYFFPDMMAAIGLWLIDGNGPVLPAYVAVYYVTLAVMAGWALQAATNSGWSAWLGGVALVNGLLAWQGVADHAHYLWLLGTLGFHGGAVLMGLASFALWAGDPASAPVGVRRAGALVLLGLGIFSDTLFLTQCVLPLGAVLWLQAGRDWKQPRVRAYAIALCTAVAAVVIVKIALGFAGWFKFSKVVRYAPTPAAVGGAAMDFIRDTTRVLAPDAWGFALLIAGALGGVGWLWWRQRRAGGLFTAGQLASGWVLLALGATTALPIVTVYWRNEHHVRYLLPWLVFPGWLLLVWLLPRLDLAANFRRLLVLAAGLVVLAALAWPRIQAPALWVWPYREQQAQFDDFARSHGLRHGLSDYWHAHEIGVQTHAGVRLFPLRPVGRASFWNNNAFWFYESGADGWLERPVYSFIITNGLDETVLLQRFGEPANRERVGELSIWLYDPEMARQLTRSMDAEVRAFLRGRPGEEKLPVAGPDS